MNELTDYALHFEDHLEEAVRASRARMEQKVFDKLMAATEKAEGVTFSADSPVRSYTRNHVKSMSNEQLEILLGK